MVRRYPETCNVDGQPVASQTMANNAPVAQNGMTPANTVEQ
jgi:hypothetical protein